MCAWKIVNNVIPTRKNITKKGTDINTLCCFGKKREESTTHLFWVCKISKNIWLDFFPNLSGLFSVCREGWDPQEIKRWIVDDAKEDEIDVALLILWNLWNSRIKISSNNSQVDPIQIHN